MYDFGITRDGSPNAKYAISVQGKPVFSTKRRRRIPRTIGLDAPIRRYIRLNIGEDIKLTQQIGRKSDGRVTWAYLVTHVFE